MALPDYLEVLRQMNFTDDVLSAGLLRIVRHKSSARTFFDQGWKEFEEFQRFQGAREYGNSKFVVAFLGLPNQAGLSTFAGIYHISGISQIGTPQYIEPSGSSELLAELATTNRYRYEMRRLIHLDSWVGQWEVDWQLPHPAWSLKMRESLPIVTTSFQSEYQPETLLIPTSIDEIAAFPEGAMKLLQHLRRERSSELVKTVKAYHKMQGTYCCAVCKLAPGQVYVNDIDCLECHHSIPVKLLDTKSSTSIEDMVLLCSNCHTAVHRHHPWLEKDDLYKLLMQS